MRFPTSVLLQEGSFDPFTLPHPLGSGPIIPDHREPPTHSSGPCSPAATPWLPARVFTKVNHDSTQLSPKGTSQQSSCLTSQQHPSLLTTPCSFRYSLLLTSLYSSLPPRHLLTRFLCKLLSQHEELASSGSIFWGSIRALFLPSWLWLPDLSFLGSQNSTFRCPMECQANMNKASLTPRRMPAHT